MSTSDVLTSGVIRAVRSEQFYEALVEDSVDPIAVIDPNLILRFVSRSIKAMLGIDPDAWVGRSVADLLEPESLEIALKGLLEWDLTTHDPTQPEAPVRLKLRSADGEVVPIDATIRDTPRTGIEGYVVQLHPAAASQAMADAVDAVLEGAEPTEAMWRLASLVEHRITRTAAALGTGWDGDHFVDAAGDDLIDLTALQPANRDAIRFALRSGQDIVDLWGHLDTRTRASAAKRGMHACWCAPISGDTRDAALIIWHTDPGPPGIVYSTAIRRSVGLTRLALRWRSHQDQLTWDVTHDQLTGLTNRMEFQNRLDASCGQPRAVLFCDLDDFKPVNERLGHRAGDEVLAAAAGRMNHICPDCVVARLGGDEFAILLCAVTDIDDALGVADRTRRALSTPIAVRGHQATVGVTIGIAFDATGTAHSDLLLDEADRLLRLGKARGKNQVLTTIVTHESTPVTHA